MARNRRSFSKSAAAALLSIFGLVGFNNNIDSRVYAMNQNGPNEGEKMETIVESGNDGDISLNVDEMKLGRVFKRNRKDDSANNVEKSSVTEDNNNKLDLEYMINNPTAESIIMDKKGDKNEKNGEDNTDDKKDDKKGGENEKWSTGKKAGVIGAIIVLGMVLIGGVGYLINRFLSKKNNAPARGLAQQNLNQISQSNKI